MFGSRGEVDELEQARTRLKDFCDDANKYLETLVDNYAERGEEERARHIGDVIRANFGAPCCSREAA